MLERRSVATVTRWRWTRTRVVGGGRITWWRSGRASEKRASRRSAVKAFKLSNSSPLLFKPPLSRRRYCCYRYCMAGN